MLLVLGAVLVFILIGLGSGRLDWRQQTLVVAVAIGLAAVQYTFPRFL